METINDVLYYLNKLDFTDNVDDSDYENLRCVKRTLVNEIEDYNIPKLIDVLSIVDNLFITLTVGKLQDISIKTNTVGKLQDISIKTNTLRENIFYLISFKHFVKSNGKSD